MGKHTTPGLDTPGTRDDFVGWGAFSTLVSAIFVGLFAGWFEAFGVFVLGGLATAALWFARQRTGDALGRGRHASETPWPPSDLLDLLDADAQQAAATAAPAAVDQTAAGGRPGRRAQEAPARRSQPSDPLAWLPGQQTGGRRVADGPPAGPDTQDGPGPVDADAGGRRGGRRAAAAPLVPGQGRQGVPAVRTPSSRRSRRTGEPSSAVPVQGASPRTVLPVAPFEMGSAARDPHGTSGPAAPAAPTLPGVQVPAGGVPAPTPMTGVSQLPVPGRLPVAPMPVAPIPGASAATAAPMPVLPARPVPDPLSGPLNHDAVAAEPTVLDPALDPLWPAPTPPETAPPAAPSTDRSVTERANAAAALDPLWARRARRPELRRAGMHRPPAVRREPAPLEPIPRDEAVAAESLPLEPYLVVLPDPDVPDVLMLPDVAWNGAPDVPPSRPAPGTLSLDELLVLHTRRPSGRRSATEDQPTEITERRLE